jgi:DnaJ-class molecular chaperone
MEVLNTIALLVKSQESFKIQAINVYVKMDITMMESILSAQVIIKFYN